MRREVLLRPEFTHLYPALEAGKWYTAAAVAGLVKGSRLVMEGLDLEFTERILNEEHFLFRGGSPRHGIWVGLRTRWMDRHAASTSTGHLAIA